MSGTYDREHNKYKLNPVPSFNFALEVEAMFFMPLKAVRVFTKENEFEYYQEGGLNDYVHMLRKPISKPFTFQVERYVGVSATTDFNASFMDPIAMGTELILPVVLYVTHLPAGDSGDNFRPTNTTRAYIFTGCTVISKEYGELNAERSGLLTDVTTISYRELLVMNTLNPSWEGGKMWNYDAKTRKEEHAHTENRTKDQDKKIKSVLWQYDGTKTGKGERRKFKKLETKDCTPQEEMEKGKSLWEYDGKTVKGGGTSHDNNKTPKQDTKTAKSLWEYDGKTVKGGGTSHDNNKTKNQDTKTAKSLWEYDGKTVKGGGTAHDNNKTKKQDTKTAKSLWEYDGKTVKGGGTPHDTNKTPKQETKREQSLWEYDGKTVKGSGKPHDNNKTPNQEKKAERVLWPPTRRALMANELMK